MRLTAILRRYCKRPGLLLFALGSKSRLRWMPDAPYLKLMFRSKMGETLHLDAPVTYNEKLQWLKLYYRPEQYPSYVDKYAVRAFIGRTIGKEYLVPLIGVYDRVEDIPWTQLPRQFVLKCTHGSGCNIICTDKGKLDISRCKQKLNRWMKHNWYWFGREWVYRPVRPQIVCEAFLGTGEKVPYDYKVLCFNGKAKLIGLHQNRYSANHTHDYYTAGWEKTTISIGGKTSPHRAEKPACLEEMLCLSERLAVGMPHVRVDWYVVDGKLYFGELTFFPSAGFAPFSRRQDDELLGSWIDLPAIAMQSKRRSN